MEIKYATKNYNLSDKLKGIVERKIQRVEKYFTDDAGCVIVCSRSNNEEKMEVTIVSGGHTFRAQAANDNMFKNVDEALSKLERQVVKNKEKIVSGIHKHHIDERNLVYLSHGQAKKIVDPEIRKNKSFSIKVLSEKEAEIHLSTLDHDFFVYADEVNHAVKIMYRRGDGHVGVIEVSNAMLKADIGDKIANAVEAERKHITNEIKSAEHKSAPKSAKPAAAKAAPVVSAPVAPKAAPAAPKVPANPVAAKAPVAKAPAAKPAPKAPAKPVAKK
jgi:putative sigma-54 modulation protein